MAIFDLSYNLDVGLDDIFTANKFFITLSKYLSH